MNIYYILYFNSLLLSFFSINKNQFPPIIFLFINIIFFVFIVGFRYESTDYMQYWFIYDSINNFEQISFPVTQLENDWKTTETGFALLILFEKYFTNSFYAFVFLFSFL